MTYSPNNRGRYGYDTQGRGIQEITIMEEAVTEINLIVEDGVGHLRDTIEAGEIIEVSVTEGLGQVLE